MRSLKRFGLDRKKSEVLIQSFEIGNLRELDRLTRPPIEQLIDSRGAPFDQVAAGTGVTYTQMTTSGTRPSMRATTG